MKVREMTLGEVSRFFGDGSQRGLLALAESGEIAGQVAYHTQGDEFYAHSLFCDDGFPTAAAALFQAARRTCRRLGYSSGTFCVDADNPHLLRLVQRGRATIETYVLRMEA